MSKFNQKEEDTFRSELFRRMDKQDSILERIETQTTKHNGRMTTIETRLIDYEKYKEIVSSLSGWKMWLMGAVAVIIVASGLVWNLALNHILDTVQLRTQEIIDKQKAQIIKDIITTIDQTYNLELTQPK